MCHTSVPGSRRIRESSGRDSSVSLLTNSRTSEASLSSQRNVTTCRAAPSGPGAACSHSGMPAARAASTSLRALATSRESFDMRAASQASTD